MLRIILDFRRDWEFTAGLLDLRVIIQQFIELLIPLPLLLSFQSPG